MMSPEEKASRKRQRLIESSKVYSTGTYLRKVVAVLFQKMIRAEFAAKPDGFEFAVVKGELFEIPRYVGECVCVTCGKVHAWDSGIKGIHTGHFVASRRNSILMDEQNVYPQCSSCNVYRDGSPVEFRLYMQSIHGEEVIERLQRLKTESVSFSREELVDRRIQYDARLNAAIERMTNGESVDVPW